MNKVAVFDIDSTLADPSHRLQYLERKPKDWDRFFDEVVYDKPITHNIQLLLSLARDGWATPLFTGRPRRTQQDTSQWLQRYGIHWTKYKLFMRSDGDRRADFIVKSALAKKIEKEYKPDVLVFFEDRSQVVSELRGLGYNVMQCAKGDY